MKVFYLVVCALCCIDYTKSQFFYSHYTPLAPQVYHQPFLPVPTPIFYTQNQATSKNSVTYNLPSSPTPEYRGFGYRTDYTDGATSTVFYVTGPEAENLQPFKDFPNFNRKIQEAAGRARSLASDITDRNAVPDANVKIQNVLESADFQKIFESVMPGVVNFYNYPAGTVPLALTRQLLNGTNDNSTTTTTTTTTTTASNIEEAEAAESVVNANVVPNDISETSTASSTTTETVPPPTSEKTDSVVAEAKEANEASTSTTIETTTTQ